MAYKESRGKKHRWIVWTLVSVAIAFLVLVSVQERHGLDLGLPKPFKLDFLHTLLDDHIHMGGNEAGTGDFLEDAEVKVHFIDVGQGKSILIQAPEKNVLIDAGENGYGTGVLKYLSAQKVGKIDIAIGTHPHSDHIGGLDTVIKGIPVESVILPRLTESSTPTTPTYTDMLQAIADKGLKITVAKPGDSYDLGGGAALAILGPLELSEDLNDMSVISRLDYGKTSFLFTGDATKYVERELLAAGSKLSATVLDVGHHGSTTSSSPEFLRAVNPLIAVFSCGLDNQHGHPNRQVVERFKNLNTEMYRTDLNGSVIISADKENVAVKSEKRKGA